MDFKKPAALAVWFLHTRKRSAGDEKDVRSLLK
jgi:hypothetical protein